MSTCLPRAKAEKNANALAKRILDGSCHIDEADVLRVLKALFNTKKPLQQNRFSANPPGKRSSVGGVLGATVPFRTGKIELKLHNFDCQACKDIARLLNKFREQELAIQVDGDDQVRPTCIQLNHNFEGDVHVDGNNLGPSHIMGFGDYSKGDLLVESATGSVQRELVAESSKRRTPGVYKFDGVDISTGIQMFNGATHLHCAKAAEGGERFSVIWFSLGASQLKRCESNILESLRAMGFRPRSQEEVALVERSQQMPNDTRSYPPGFLFFCRAHRLALEATVDSSTATARLHQDWNNLRSCGEIEQHEKERFQKYWAKLESIARRPRRSKKSDVDSQKQEGEDSTNGIKRFSVPAQASSTTEEQVVDVEDDDSECDEADEADEADSNSMDNEAFYILAEHVLEEFPQALDGTEQGFSLLLHLLQMFGFEGGEMRSKAYDIIKAKQQERSDNAIAQRIHRNEQLGRSGSFESQITIDDSQTPDKSQIATDDSQTPNKSPPKKKFRGSEVNVTDFGSPRIEDKLAASSCGQPKPAILQQGPCPHQQMPSVRTTQEESSRTANLPEGPEPVTLDTSPQPAVAKQENDSASLSGRPEPIILDAWPSPTAAVDAPDIRGASSLNDHERSMCDVLSTGSSDDIIEEVLTDEETVPADVLTNATKNDFAASSSGRPEPVILDPWPSPSDNDFPSGSPRRSEHEDHDFSQCSSECEEPAREESNVAENSFDQSSRIPTPTTQSSEISEERAVRTLMLLMKRSGADIVKEVKRRIDDGQGFKLKGVFFPVTVLRKALQQHEVLDDQDAQKAQQLVDMGITCDVEVARRALHDSHGDPNLAATMLLSAGLTVD